MPLPLDGREYYIIYGNRPFLAWKDGDEYKYMGCFGEVKIEGEIKAATLLILPDLKDLNGWNLSYQEVPCHEDVYSCSDTVLTYDSRKGAIEECFYCPMGGWHDAESGAPYSNNQYKPNFWKYFPINEELIRR
jgi:hypothetical protein